MNQETLNSKGYLIINARGAGGALPIEGVNITVRSPLGEETSLATDTSGVAGPIEIRTPERALSLSPGMGVPYSLVDITAEKEGYYLMSFYDVAIYPEVTSIQPINMIPISEYEDGGNLRIYEGGVPNL